MKQMIMRAMLVLSMVCAVLFAVPAHATYTVVTQYAATVDATGTQTAVPLGTFRNWVTIQNVDTANTLYLSATTPVTTSNSIVLTPGMAITLPIGVASTLYGMSGTGTVKLFAIGY